MVTFGLEDIGGVEIREVVLRVEGRSTGNCFCASSDAPATPGTLALLLVLLGARLRTRRR